MRNCEKINFKLSRRINFRARGGGGSHSGAMATDDNEAHGNLDKRELKFIFERFQRFSDYISSFRDAWRDPKNRFDMIDAARAVLIVTATMALATGAAMFVFGK